MALRKGHGNGRGQPRIETLPADELPAPVPAEPVRIERRPNGQLATPAAAKTLGAMGGAAKAARAKLVAGLGLKKVDAGHPFAPYMGAAEDFLEGHLAELARMAGGRVGSGPSSLVASAAMQLAASRYCFDRGVAEGDTALLKQGSGLSNDSRQNLAMAFELAVREAAARLDEEDDDLAQRQAEYQRRLAQGR